MDGIERGENKNAKETVMFNLSSARKIENYCEIIYIYIYIYIYIHINITNVIYHFLTIFKTWCTSSLKMAHYCRIMLE